MSNAANREMPHIFTYFMIALLYADSRVSDITISNIPRKRKALYAETDDTKRKSAFHETRP